MNGMWLVVSNHCGLYIYCFYSLLWLFFIVFSLCTCLCVCLGGVVISEKNSECITLQGNEYFLSFCDWSTLTNNKNGLLSFCRGYLLTSCWHAGGALSFPVPQTAIHGCFLSGSPPSHALRTHLPANTDYMPWPWSMTAPLTSVSSGYAPPSHIICVSTGDVLATVKENHKLRSED